MQEAQLKTKPVEINKDFLDKLKDVAETIDHHDFIDAFGKLNYFRLNFKVINNDIVVDEKSKTTLTELFSSVKKQFNDIADMTDLVLLASKNMEHKNRHYELIYKKYKVASDLISLIGDEAVKAFSDFNKSIAEKQSQKLQANEQLAPTDRKVDINEDNRQITEEWKQREELIKGIKGIIEQLTENLKSMDKKPYDAFLEVKKKEIKKKIRDLAIEAKSNCSLIPASKNCKEDILKQINETLSTYCTISSVNLQKPKGNEGQKYKIETKYEYEGCFLSKTANVLADGVLDGERKLEVGEIKLEVQNVQDCFKGAKFTLEVPNDATKSQLDSFVEKLNEKLQTSKTTQQSKN